MASPWFSLATDYWRNPKIAQAGLLASTLNLAAIAYCAEQLTDGVVPSGVVAQLAAPMHGYVWVGEDGVTPTPADVFASRWDSLASVLVAMDVWHEAGHDCPSCKPCPPACYLIHDYLKHQPSREEVEQNREKRRSIAARASKARWSGNASKDASKDASSNASSNASQMLDSCSGDAPAMLPVPTPIPAANAAAAMPPQPLVAELKERLSTAGLTARWDKVTPDDLTEITTLVEAHGVTRLVKAAQKAHRPDSPAAFAQAWLGVWRALPTTVTVVREKCPIHRQEQPCSGCAADAKAVAS